MQPESLIVLFFILCVILYISFNYKEKFINKENFEYCLDNDNINFIKKREDQCTVYEKKLANKVTFDDSKNVSYCIDNDYNIFSREQCSVDEMEVFMQ
jgi:hypothetical protein